MLDFSAYQEIRIDKDGGVVTITLNRPDQRNAVNVVMHSELEDVFVRLNDEDDVRAVILTGAGKAFSGGGDIKAMVNRVETGYHSSHNIKKRRGGRRLLENMLNLEPPLIAAVNGHATGLGATIALFCDIVIMAESAKIGDTHVNVGLVAGDGGAVIWPLLIGPSRAKYYLMTGELISAQEAYSLGLVHKVVPDADLMNVTKALAERLASGPTLAISWSKMAVNKHIKSALNTIIDSSLSWEHHTLRSEDHSEAAHAFLEKRKPVFKGR